MHHVTVYRKEGRYAGWPANYGIWSWGDEIVVGFTLGYHKADGGFHARDRDRPFVTMQARSTDGGETWDVDAMPCRAPGGGGLSADEHMRSDLGVGKALSGKEGLMTLEQDLDLTHPDLALMCARSGLNAGARSWFYVSLDRCRTWLGPHRLPMFSQTGVAARTDYIISGPKECVLFLTASKPNGDEGRVFCARTSDGCRSFRFLSWVTPEPEGFTIMPASIRLRKSRVLVAVRCREPTDRNWIDLYESKDDCATWRFVNRPVANTGTGGNPPTLTMLADGRLCLTYGYRDPPFGLRARLSEDEGMTWGEEIILRDDGGNHDLGYPRTVQRADGKIVTVYYFNDHPEGERYLAATVWQP